MAYATLTTILDGDGHGVKTDAIKDKRPSSGKAGGFLG
jgi:hypothetical protein